MVEGRDAADQEIGRSGFVGLGSLPPRRRRRRWSGCRADPRLRRRMGEAGRRRVAAYDQRRDMLAAYRALYAAMGAHGTVTRLRRFRRWRDKPGRDRMEAAASHRSRIAGRDHRRLSDRRRRHQRASRLLTTAVLTSLRLVARRSGADFYVVERFLTVVYAVTVIGRCSRRRRATPPIASTIIIWKRSARPCGGPPAPSWWGFVLCGVLLALIELLLGMAVVAIPTAIIARTAADVSLAAGSTR